MADILTVPNEFTAETIPFNFDEIETRVKELFDAKGYDIEEGSNTMQLVTAMSYIASMLNANTAVNINETLLTQAKKRENVLKTAEILGYVPKYKTSYRYNIKLQFDAEGIYDIDKFTVFEANGNKYYYMGGTDGSGLTVNVTADNIPHTEIIEVVEGDLKSWETLSDLNYTVTTTLNNKYIDIPYKDVENDFLEVRLTYVDETGTTQTKELWNKHVSLILDHTDSLLKKYVRIDDIEMSTPRLYFSLSGLGNTLNSDTLIYVNALVSKGSNGEMTSIPTTTLDGVSVVGYGSDFDASNTLATITGSDEESNESIKTNAPVVNNTASRVVTTSDYISVIDRNTLVNTSYVWGGEDEYYEKLGHIFTSMYPETAPKIVIPDTINVDTYELSPINSNTIDLYYLSTESENNEVQVIHSELSKYKIATIKLLNRQPNYLNVDLKIKTIKYPSSKTRSNTRKEILTSIVNYFESLDGYDTEFFISNIIKRIDQTLTDNSGVELSFNTHFILNNKILLNEELNENGDVRIYERDIKMYLDLPYTDYRDDTGRLITANLPQIDTDNFINGKKLYVDFNKPKNLSLEYMTNFANIEYPIRLEGDNNVLGKYGVYTVNNQEYIMIHFYACKDCENSKILIGSDTTNPAVIYPKVIGNPEVLDDGFYIGGNLFGGISNVYDKSALTTTLLEPGIKLNVKYPTSSLKTIRNTITKLNNVTFEN